MCQRRELLLKFVLQVPQEQPRAITTSIEEIFIARSIYFPLSQSLEQQLSYMFRQEHTPPLPSPPPSVVKDEEDPYLLHALWCKCMTVTPQAIACNPPPLWKQILYLLHAYTYIPWRRPFLSLQCTLLSRGLIPSSRWLFHACCPWAQITSSRCPCLWFPPQRHFLLSRSWYRPREVSRGPVSPLETPAPSDSWFSPPRCPSFLVPFLS